MIVEQQSPTTSAAPLQAGDALSRELFHDIRSQMVLQHCKWDPQIGDVSTISPFPLLLKSGHWRYLSDMTTLLSQEAFEAEKELFHRPELHSLLGLPRRLRWVLRQVRKLGSTPSIAARCDLIFIGLPRVGGFLS